MIPSCRTAFRLLTHVSLLQYRRSLNVLDFGRTLAHISARYACISYAWTQWEKNNNRPNYSEELKRVFAWPSSHYSNHPWSFLVFMGNPVAHDILENLIYFYYIYIFINLKEICVYVGRKCSSLRGRVKPSLAWFSWDGIPYTTSFLDKFDKY